MKSIDELIRFYMARLKLLDQVPKIEAYSIALKHTIELKKNTDWVKIYHEDKNTWPPSFKELEIIWNNPDLWRQVYSPVIFRYFSKDFTLNVNKADSMHMIAIPFEQVTHYRPLPELPED